MIPKRTPTLLILATLTLLGLALRLVVWQWREFQPLGGDEQEYLAVAVTLLRDRQYTELLFMRPPLYPVFLAGSIVLVDSLVQQLRLVQVVLSTATIPLVYMLAHAVALTQRAARPQLVGLIAAGLAAANYTLAANANELLTETLFLFGLTGVYWLVLRAANLGTWQAAALAGLGLGALALVRSVALPLLPLGLLWLAVRSWPRSQRAGQRAWWPAIQPVLSFGVATLLVILPWTARNYLSYGGLIVIDTTGAENLWLDNDPAGREAVKAQLFALGEDRLARQQLASQQGRAVILADPARFASKAWAELIKLFALEYSDDMLARPAIWVSPGEIAARLLLGDTLWLLLLLVGSYGLSVTLFTRPPGGEQVAAASRTPGWLQQWIKPSLTWLQPPTWLFAAWCLYIALTAMIFHVELRYRLPLYPVLLAYTALVLARLSRSQPRRATPPGPLRRSVSGPQIAGMVVSLSLVGLTLLHANYPALAWQLGPKHWNLAWAEHALMDGDLAGAERAATAALERDPRSALARIALAQVAIQRGDQATALALLDSAVQTIRDHPQAHVLRGDLRRALGDQAGARTDLAYETASRQDLQHWLWERASTPPSARLTLGDGLDLGFGRGLHALAPSDDGYRWTRARAELRLRAPDETRELRLQLASGRPPGSPAIPVTVRINETVLATLQVGTDWQTFSLPLSLPAGDVIIELRSPTFRPRQFDPASPDGRQLGVKLAWVERGTP